MEKPSVLDAGPMTLTYPAPTSPETASPKQLQKHETQTDKIIEAQTLHLSDHYFTFKIPIHHIEKEPRNSFETSFLIPARDNLPEYDVIVRPRRQELSQAFGSTVELAVLTQDNARVQQTIPRLTPSQRIMALSHRQSESQRSLVAPLFFTLACGGKIIMGFGAATAVQAAFTPPEPVQAGIITGSVLAGIGALSVICASLGFGSAVVRVYPRFGWTIKGISITAAMLITLGDVISQYYFSTGEHVRLIRLTFLPLFVGTAALAISLPNFVAYTELYRGRISWLPYSKRPLAALIFLGIAKGLMFGGWVSGEHAEWPPAFNLAIMTGAIALGYFGAAILWSDHVRRRACAYEVRLCIEEEESGWAKSQI